jgi:plastocyanin
MKKFLLALSFILTASFANSKTHIIKAINYKFTPAQISIAAGDTVIWENTSNEAHTSTSGSACKGDGKWDSGMINPGKRYTRVFQETGVFRYFCTPHCADSMNGKITVKPGRQTGHHNAPYSGELLHNAGFNTSVAPAISLNPPEKHIVKMLNYTFQPAELKVNPGDTVVWQNETQTTHTTTSGTTCKADGNWDSGSITAGQQYTTVITAQGVYDYFCTPHCSMGMTGRIIAGQAESAPPREQEKDASVSFRSSDIINNQSVTTLPAGHLEFKIYHRFDDLAGKVGSFHNFYGLDNIRDYRIGFAYGITDRLMAGIGRNKGDQFQAPYQAVTELYDGFLKYRILKQRNEPGGKAAFSLALFANTVLSAMKSQTNNVYSEAYFPRFSDRFSHCFQVLAGYNFKNRLSLQVMPTYLKRNWVNVWVTDKDEINLFSLGGAARWNLTRHFSVVTEYFYTFSDYRERHKDVFANPLSAGIEIYTGKHIFHLNLNNSTGLIPNTFIPYTTSSWGKGQFRFGFSITRLFTLKKQVKVQK